VGDKKYYGVTRYMVTVRTAKAKGSSFEYDCQYSLGKIYPDIFRTSERGFTLQYDLQTDNGHAVFECKRLKALSWNQAVKFFKKLQEKSPNGYRPYLLFQSNRQPCLVMYSDPLTYEIYITQYETLFKRRFEKHESTRKKNITTVPKQI